MATSSDKRIEDLLASKKRKIPVIPVIFVSLVIIIALFFYFDLLSLFGTDQEDTLISKEQAIAEKGNMVSTLTSSGTAKAGAQSNVYSSSSGEIKEVKFSVGDEVKEGDVLITFDDESAERNLEISKSSLRQAKLTLQELEDSPTEGEILNANQSTTSAQQQLVSSQQQLTNAKISLDKLIAPDISNVNNLQANVVSAEGSIISAEGSVVSSQANVVSAEGSIISAEGSVVSSQANVVSAEGSIDNAYIELLDAQQGYCDGVLTVGPYTDEKAPVCATIDLPLSDSNKTRLLNDIKRENDPTVARINTTQALLLANSSYNNAKGSLETAKSNQETAKGSLETAKSNLETAKSNQETAKGSLETAKSNLETAKSNLDILLNPPDRDLKQAQTTIESASSSVTNAETALKSAIQSEKDVLDGVSQFQIEKQMEVVYSAELSVAENQKQLDSLVVVSPRDGVIGEINVSVGDKVGASTLLSIVSDITSISVDLAISESDVGGIKEGLYGIAMFDSLPEEFYIVEITNVSIIPNINQGIVSYPVEAGILKTKDIALALPELAKYASGISDSSEIGGFLSPGGMAAGRPSGDGFDRSNLDLDCLQKALGEDFDISKIGPATFQRIRDSGCLQGRPQGMSGGSSMLSMIDQFIPSKMPAAGMGANVILFKDLKENLILVPSKAVQRKERATYIKTLVGEEEVNVNVEVGESDGIRSSILFGINEGDVVIIETQVYEKSDDSSLQSNQDAEQGHRPPPGPPRQSGFRGGAGQ